jgi:hypothetical protein
MKNMTSDLPPKLQPFISLLDAQPPEVQEAFQFLLATAMHEGRNPRLGKFELLNLAGGFPAKRTLFVTAISHPQKTSHPKKPAIKLPTMELAKLTTSLFSQGQGMVWTTKNTLHFDKLSTSDGLRASGRPRKARNAFVCFALFRAVRVPNRPGRPAGYYPLHPNFTPPPPSSTPNLPNPKRLPSSC